MMSSYGQRTTQFIDLLGFFTIKTSHPALTELVCYFYVSVIFFLFCIAATNNYTILNFFLRWMFLPPKHSRC